MNETDDMVESRQFTCPKCGSHHFGSGADAGESMMGMCHGYVNEQTELARHETTQRKPCGFVWPRSEDAKYFKGTGVFHPRVQVAEVVGPTRY